MAIIKEEVSQEVILSSSRQIDEEPITANVQVDEHTPEIITSDNVKRGGALSNLKRELSEEELKTPGAIRMLLSKIDDYDNCQKDLQEYKDKFHQCDKKCAVLETAAKSSKAFDILYSFLLSFGSAIIGVAPSIKVDDTQSYIPWILGIIGIIALGGGIFAKIFKS
ncbi:MAG: hypothetical protein IJ155_00225 [Prevotella sp.]|jgi:hypothetical protein|nr:hypothetical protein [Prevotella sp.]